MTRRKQARADTNDRKETTVRPHESGENTGDGIDFDALPMGSVIYMGRGSFRMEAVALTPEPELEAGVVQPIATAVVTAPLHATPSTRGARPVREQDVEGPSVRPLFGSQVDVPVLAAPTGAVGLTAPSVALSRAMLATLGGLVLLCGIVVGTAARHLFAGPRSTRRRRRRRRWWRCPRPSRSARTRSRPPARSPGRQPRARSPGSIPGPSSRRAGYTREPIRSTRGLHPTKEPTMKTILALMLAAAFLTSRPVLAGDEAPKAEKAEKAPKAKKEKKEKKEKADTGEKTGETKTEEPKKE
jgi:hypothetical protein